MLQSKLADLRELCVALQNKVNRYYSCSSVTQNTPHVIKFSMAMGNYNDMLQMTCFYISTKSNQFEHVILSCFIFIYKFAAARKSIRRKTGTGTVYLFSCRTFKLSLRKLCMKSLAFDKSKMFQQIKEFVSRLLC